MEWLKTVTLKGHTPVVIPIASIKKIEEHPKWSDSSLITREMEDMEVAESVDTLYCKLCGLPVKDEELAQREKIAEVSEAFSLHTGAPSDPMDIDSRRKH